MKRQPPAPKAVASKPAVTPIPWTLDTAQANKDNGGKFGVIADTEGGEGVAECYTKADAALIVKAVNSHAALAALAKQYRAEAVAQGASDEDVKEIDDVLMLAGEGI